MADSESSGDDLPLARFQLEKSIPLRTCTEMADSESSGDDLPLARFQSEKSTPLGTCTEMADSDMSSEDDLARCLPEQSPPTTPTKTPTVTPRKDKKRMLTPNSKSLPQPSSKRQITSTRRKEDKVRSLVRGYLLQNMEEGSKEDIVLMDKVLTGIHSHGEQMAKYCSSKEEEEAMEATTKITSRTLIRLVKTIFEVDYNPEDKTLSCIRWKPTVLDGLQLATDDTTQIQNIRTLIDKVDVDLEEGWANISKFGAEHAMASHFAALWVKRNKLVSTLVRLYREHIDSLREHEKSGSQLSKEQRVKLSEEMKAFENLVSVGIRERVIDDVPESLFSQIASALPDECPLIHSILQTLVVKDDRSQNKVKTNAFKMKSATHALCALLDLRSSRASNDVTILFGLVSVSYGAGKQFVTLLQHLGLSESWDTLMSFMGKRLDNFQTTIDDKFGDSGPVMFAYDNINILRAVRHMRVMKGKAHMWNFTVRMAIKPNLEGIKELFTANETSEMPQKPVEDLTADDVFLHSHPDLAQVWEKAKDDYFLDLLDTALNKLPKDIRDQADKTTTQQKTWLSKQELKNSHTYTIGQSPAAPPNSKKTDILVLPLSTENEATLTGTACINEEFAREFNIPIERSVTKYLPFDENSINFDISLARKRYEFNLSIEQHRVDQDVLLNSMSNDAWAEDEHVPVNMMEDQLEKDDDEPNEPENSRHLGPLRRRWKEEDEKMGRVVADMRDKLASAKRAGNAADILEFRQYVLDTKDCWFKIRDHLGRSIVHAVVELEDVNLLQHILDAGVDVDCEEGCGATPLCLAVLRHDNNMVRCLIETQAVSVDGPAFLHFPSPVSIASRLGHNDSLQIMEGSLPLPVEDENLNMLFASEGCEEIGSDVDTLICQMERVQVEEEEEMYTFHRKNAPNVTVGDGLTNKNHLHCRLSDEVAFGWTTEMPGDMHTSGYAEECFAKSQGPGGLFHIISDVIKRKKVKKETYGKDKFKENNLQLIREANRDVAYGYGLAAVLEFACSNLFPSEAELSNCEQDQGPLLVSKFKDWIASCSEDDVAFRYRIQSVSLFGPLNRLYYSSIKNGDGRAREAVWMILLPVFSQSKKKNYWIEALSHVVNMTAAWPIAIRRMVQENCSVSVDGREGHNIAIDEYVETHLVKPLKQYCSGQTTLKTLKRLNVNLQLIGSARACYKSRSGFDVHNTKRHSEPSPFQDQIFVSLFCLKERFFMHDPGRRKVKMYPGSDSEKFVPNDRCDVYSKGCEKVRSNFNRKMYDIFPSRRRVPSVFRENVPPE
ncbi:uncharacterized protein [Branchiostoma lanceolatum]|uniref:uncharacterized protein n=1 Tax=Branchiostoma lanceolatum TaxID=7740 RepID=UPI003454E2B3